MVAEFNLLPSSLPHQWGIAADRFEELDGCPVTAESWRQNDFDLSKKSSGYGYGAGSGSGYGYGDGSGSGDGYGYGDGDGSGAGYGDG